MTSETDPNYITYHHNWFDHSDSRHARVRTMSVHMWNNYYDGCAKYGIGSTMGSSVFSENNYFRHTKNPLLSSEQGTDAKGDGTFSGEDGGIIKEYGSIFDSEGYSGNYTPISYDDNNTSFDAYIASTRDEQVPSSVVTLQGGTYYDNFDTDDDLMYTYTPDATANVPTNVTGYYGAGRLNHGNFQYTFDNSTQDTDYGVITALRDAISAYTGESVSISGSSSSETVGGSEVGDTDEGTDNNESEDTDDTESGSTSTDVTVTSSVECTFADKTPSNSAFTVTGNYSTSYGTATVNGTTLDTCVKMESSTSITFTTTAEMTLTLVFSETNGNYNIKVDGTKVTSDSNVLTTTLAAGSHTLTKADVAYLFYIGLATTSTTTE